ncbi:hypothetical protein DFJ74DRAFT_175759 [Hyaloraphidium curvatum]|nr:hypothetical protein DFJ74DRAFT_175759 [Hyaloraphidium curvatum]
MPRHPLMLPLFGAAAILLVAAWSLFRAPEERTMVHFDAYRVKSPLPATSDASPVARSTRVPEATRIPGAPPTTSYNVSRFCNVTLEIAPTYLDGPGARNRRSVQLFMFCKNSGCGYRHREAPWYDHVPSSKLRREWNALFELPSYNTSCLGGAEAEDGCYRPPPERTHPNSAELLHLARKACTEARARGREKVLLGLTEAIGLMGRATDALPRMSEVLPWTLRRPCSDGECDPRELQVAVHIRRGDIFGRPGPHAGRVVPNSFYVGACNALSAALETLRLPKPFITVYMDAVPPEKVVALNLSDFDAIRARHVVNVSGDGPQALDAFKALVRADVLVQSISGFSQLAAMLHDPGRGLVILPQHTQPYDRNRPDFFVASGNEEEDVARLTEHVQRHLSALTWRFEHLTEPASQQSGASARHEIRNILLADALLQPPPARLGRLTVVRNVCLASRDPGHPYPTDLWFNATMATIEERMVAARGVQHITVSWGRRENGTRPTWVPGATFLPVCEWPSTPQLAHLMFGMAFAISLSERWPESAGPRPVFRNVSFSWCPWHGSTYHPGFKGWEFGRHLIESSFTPWTASGMLADDVSRAAFQPKAACYEELWVASKLRGLVLDLRDDKVLRTELARRVPEASSDLLPSEMQLLDSLLHRCSTHSLRIAVFARPEAEWNARSYVNVEGLTNLLGSFTSAKVAIVSTSPETSTAEHVRVHASYDVLVMPPGSHFAAVAAVPGKPLKAWVELGSVLRDRFWKEEADAWGSVYVVSTGHRTVDAGVAAAIDAKCTWKEVWPGEPQVIECPLPDAERHKLSEGKVEVDLARAKKDIELALRRLCEKGRRTKAGGQAPFRQEHVPPAALSGVPAPEPEPDNAPFSDLTLRLPPMPIRNTRLLRFRRACFAVPDGWHAMPKGGAFFADADVGPEALENLAAALVVEPAARDVVAATANRTWHRGRTLLPHCGYPDTPNLAHLMFGGAAAVALGRRPPNPPLQPFDRLAFNWCPAYSRWPEWRLGRRLTEIAFQNWQSNDLLSVPVDRAIQVPRGISCFDELFLLTHIWGGMLDPSDDAWFREALARTEPELAGTLLPDQKAQARALAERCRSRSLRIAVWRRTASRNARNVSNLPALLAAAAARTSLPVIEVTANVSLSTADHIRVFASFDVLVTPTGSHLTGFVLAPSKTLVGILEIGIALREDLWKRGAERLGAVYAVSTGHAPANPAAAEEVARRCRWAPFESNPVPVLLCRDRHDALRLTEVDFAVNATALGEHLDWTIGRLCSAGEHLGGAALM